MLALQYYNMNRNIIILIQLLSAFRRAHFDENVFGGLLGALGVLWVLDIDSI